MPDFTVIQDGHDTSNRPLFATAYMWAWWDQVCADLGFSPTIVQGAFMARAGGGAAASAGYHDGGGCFDLRTWDRTPAEVEQIVRTLRRRGAGAWVRDQRHGMDPHIHFVLGTDQPLAVGAAHQWQMYLQGRDGLAGNGPDYHWRPVPLVTTPPEDDMPTPDEIAKAVWNHDLNPIKGDPLRAGRILVQTHNRADVSRKLKTIADELSDDASKGQVRKARADIQALADSLKESESPDGG